MKRILVSMNFITYEDAHMPQADLKTRKIINEFLNCIYICLDNTIKSRKLAICGYIYSKHCGVNMFKIGPHF